MFWQRCKEWWMRMMLSFVAVRAMRGFSLVELMVTVAIVAIIAGVILTRYQDFDSVTLLRSLAYDMALSIREAQVLGVGVRRTQDDMGNPFNYPYGVHFSLDAPTSFVLFRDVDGTYGYDPSEDGDQVVSTYRIGRDKQIGALCIDDDCDVNTLDIVFERPELDPIFVVDDSVQTATEASVVAASSKLTQTVYVLSTGQISLRDSDVSLGNEYSQSSYYSQASYDDYSQSSYYSQGSYYGQGSYYSQGSYYGQGSYYSQGSYYGQGSYTTCRRVCGYKGDPNSCNTVCD